MLSIFIKKVILMPNTTLDGRFSLLMVKRKGTNKSLIPQLPQPTVSQTQINKPLSILMMLLVVFVILSAIMPSQAMAASTKTNANVNANANTNSNTNNVLRVFDKGYSCSHLVYDYGVTSAAQAHCGFSKYNGKIVELTTQCVDVARQKGQHSEIENVLITGIEDFNELITNSGDKKGVCRLVLQNYSEFVSK